jgi:hypothetical protein
LLFGLRRDVTFATEKVVASASATNAVLVLPEHIENERCPHEADGSKAIKTLVRPRWTLPIDAPNDLDTNKEMHLQQC